MIKIFTFSIIMLLISGCNSATPKNDTAENKAAAISTPETTAGSTPPAAKMAEDKAVALPAGKLIVPGKSIGLTAINEKGEEVLKRLGKPDDGDAAMGKSLSTWYSKHLADGVDSIVYQTTIYCTTNMGGADEAPRVSQARVTSPFFKTADEIGVGANFDFIKSKFPTIKKTAFYTSPINKKMVSVYDDVEKGIAFEIDNQNKCIGVTIHKPAEKGLETYLALLKGITITPVN